MNFNCTIGQKERCCKTGCEWKKAFGLHCKNKKEIKKVEPVKAKEKNKVKPVKQIISDKDRLKKENDFINKILEPRAREFNIRSQEDDFISKIKTI